MGIRPAAGIVRRAGPGAGPLLVYVALAILPVALALPRLVTGPWYHTHTPAGVRLLDGWPIAWESTYYLMHFPTFLADQRPDGVPFTSVHYRTLPNLYLATVVYAVTGSPFWSMALVDWLFWSVGGVAGYHAAMRLGARPPAAVLGALLIVAAPLFAGSIWRIDLRLGNSASMALGLWAALALFDEVRDPRRLALGLGAVLFWLSLNYQYQWILAPMLVVLAVTSARLGRRTGLGVVAGAIAVYVASTLALKAVLGLAVPNPPSEGNEIVAQAEELALARLAGIRSPAQLFGLLPGWYHVQLMVEAYHPAVFAAGVAGLWLLPARTRWLWLAATLATLGATAFYPYPWLAMSAYPLTYTGAGMACLAAGSYVARGLGAVLRARPTAATAQARPVGRLGWPVALCLAVALAALTNLDLAGDYRFLLRWWDYWERLIF
jgi:hypothetical protein